MWDYRGDRVSDGCERGRVPKFLCEYICDIVETGYVVDAHGFIGDRFSDGVFSD